MEKEHACIGEVRRLGAMAAIEIVKDPDTREPDKAKAAAIAKTANENGLPPLTAGINGNIIRFLTPLVVTDEAAQRRPFHYRSGSVSSIIGMPADVSAIMKV